MNAFIPKLHTTKEESVENGKEKAAPPQQHAKTYRPLKIAVFTIGKTIQVR